MKRLLLIAAAILMVLIVYYKWFLLPSLIGGDANYLFKSMYANYPLWPYAWTWSGHSGLGGSAMAFLSNETLTKLPIVFWGQKLGLEYGMIEKLGTFIPFLILGFASPWILFNSMFPKRSVGFISSIIFTTNTYILMLVSGGLIFLGITYALLPILILVFIKLLQNKKDSLGIPISFGLLFSVIALIDLRYAYIGVYAMIIYGLVHICIYGYRSFISLSFLKKILVALGIPIITSAHWLIPLIVGGKNPLSDLGNNYTTVASVMFFSFAKFEDSLSLLHPNWPENIFGKTYFFRPEFLCFPLLAFSSLLLKIESKQERVYVLFLSTLALIGIFLAKGANDPFGFVYVWMFEHVPGMVLFRDPTKWYSLTAISFSVLIPLVLKEVFKSTERIKRSFLNYSSQALCVLALIVFYILLILPAFKNELPGTFVAKIVPQEYEKLENFISSEPSFSRTLWLPHLQRFGYTSPNHPGVSGMDFFNTTTQKGLIDEVSKSNSFSLLQDAGVKYVIVPFDSQKEIFISDRKYDENIYKRYLEDIQKIPWLHEIQGFGKIRIFKVSANKDHIWSQNNAVVSYKKISPIKYKVNFSNNSTDSVLVFSESYDPGWTAKVDEKNIVSMPYRHQLNSFVIPANTKNIELYFAPQKWVNLGILISVVGSAVIFVLIVWHFSGFLKKSLNLVINLLRDKISS